MKNKRNSVRMYQIMSNSYENDDSQEQVQGEKLKKKKSEKNQIDEEEIISIIYIQIYSAYT